MIISFYSYKGGVGRTQLCANTAAYLYYKKQKRVLLWDWDFEAPGLHYFFNLKNEDINKKGTIELLEEYMTTIRSSNIVNPSDLKFITKEDHITSLLGGGNTVTPPNKGCIDLMTAGNYNNDFSRRTNAFDWFEFYSMMDGANYIELVKSNLEKLDYDYVFIDSRTGISDYSGICNIQLPDINVIVAAPTLQNFEGCRSIVNKIETAEYYKIKNQRPKILPILSRLDGSNPKSTEWANRFAEYFRHLILELDEHFDRQFLPEIFTDIFFKDSFLPYTPAISAGENVLFDNDPLPVKTDYRQSFINIAEYIESLKDDGQISFYKKVDEDSWLKYADIAGKAGHHEKAAIAFYQVGIKQLDPRKATEYYAKAIRENPNNAHAQSSLRRAQNELRSMGVASIEGSIPDPQPMSDLSPSPAAAMPPAPSSGLTSSKIYTMVLAFSFFVFVIYRIVTAVLENNDEKSYRTALAALSQLSGAERQQAICSLARNKNAYNNKFISTMKDSLIVQCSQIELVVKETDSTIKTYSTEISKLQKTVNASPKLMDKSKTIDSFDNKLQLKKDSLSIVKDAGQRQRLQQDTASIRKDIQDIIQEVPEFQGAQYPLQEIKKAITKQDNIINQSIVHESNMEPGYPRTSWFKEGYYLQFDSIHITLYDLNKPDNSILVEICPQITAAACGSLIGGRRAKLTTNAGYNFQYGSYSYVLRLNRIGSAGNNPFKPAAYITVEKYKR